MIDNIQLTSQRDPDPAVDRFNVDAEWDVNWPSFALATDLPHQEEWALVGVDPNKQDTLYNGPVQLGGISPNGNATTHRTKHVSLDASVLDEDPGTGALSDDEIAVKITYTPLLPTPVTAQSAEVTISA